MWGFFRRFQAVLWICLQGPPEASRGLHWAPGGSRGLRRPKAPKNQYKHGFERKMRPPRTAKASNLGEAEISRGMLKGSERPEAGCLGEFGGPAPALGSVAAPNDAASDCRINIVVGPGTVEKP